jgi:hypothetical protein
MAEAIRKGIYSEKASSTVRALFNGQLRSKAADKAKASAESRSRAQRDIYERRSQRT